MKYIVAIINNVIFISILSTVFHATVGIVFGLLSQNYMILAMSIALFILGIIMIVNVEKMLILRGK